MTTVARIHSANDAHYYTQAGEPCYEIPKADGKGMKSPTIADARKLRLLPSVTTVLKVIPKPELQNWLIEQSVLAVLTTPRKFDMATMQSESDDVFVHRVLHVEKVQDQERDIARDKGTAIHQGVEDYFTGRELAPELRGWIGPAVEAMCKYGELVCAEKILVGDGYAGKTDLILEGFNCWWIWDTKTTKKLPDPKKGAYMEHRIQLAAYAAAYYAMLERMCDAEKPIKTANCYVSTVEVGNFVICENDSDWQRDYNDGFVPALRLWQYLNSYNLKL